MARTSIETAQSWRVASVALVAMVFSFGAPWIAIVALKAIAAELGGARSAPALAGSLSVFGVGLGGLMMSYIADRIGVRWTVMFGALMICTGLAISSFGAPWQLYLGHGLFIGFLGNGSISAPLYVYVSRWFDRRRGSALALISSGAYLAGAVWPPIFERVIAASGWRETMLSFGVLETAVIVPIAAIFFKSPPDQKHVIFGVHGDPEPGPVLGWPPNVVFSLLCAAAFLCCMPMGLPQTHLIAFCSDLGILPNHGAAMLSVLLGIGFLCRQLWGLFSDRAGGLATLVVCSAIQVGALTAFLLTQDEIGLFTVSALFGLGFSGLVPAYVLVLRQFYPVCEAGWRIPALLLSSGAGMAIGGWIGGVFYDMFGYYGPAFLAAIIANLLNFAIVATLFVLLPNRADVAHVRGRARDRASPQALAAGIDAGTAQSSRTAQLHVR